MIFIKDFMIKINNFLIVIFILKTKNPLASLWFFAFYYSRIVSLINCPLWCLLKESTFSNSLSTEPIQSHKPNPAKANQPQERRGQKQAQPTNPNQKINPTKQPANSTIPTNQTNQKQTTNQQPTQSNQTTPLNLNQLYLPKSLFIPLSSLSTSGLLG